MQWSVLVEIATLNYYLEHLNGPSSFFSQFNTWVYGRIFAASSTFRPDRSGQTISTWIITNSFLWIEIGELLKAFKMQKLPCGKYIFLESVMLLCLHCALPAPPFPLNDPESESAIRSSTTKLHNKLRNANLAIITREKPDLDQGHRQPQINF